VEIHSGFAYIFTERITCNGGLPLGISGKSLALIENDNSILAAWLMMKRGVQVIPISTEDKDISLLESYSYGTRIELSIDIGNLQSIADRKNITTLVIGQTLRDFKELNTNLITLRPLISYGEDDIKELREKI